MNPESKNRAIQILLSAEAIDEARRNCEEYLSETKIYFSRAMAFLDNELRTSPYKNHRHFPISKSVALKTKFALEKLIINFESQLESNSDLALLRKSATKLNFLYEHYHKLVAPQGAPYFSSWNEHGRIYDVPRIPLGMNGW